MFANSIISGKLLFFVNKYTSNAQGMIDLKAELR
jgi:hypothetical protein